MTFSITKAPLLVFHPFLFLSPLHQATRWCDDGIYLLASQLVDKCQSQDGAEAALQEIERYLDTANQHKLTDLAGIWKEYESVLTTDFRVSSLFLNSCLWPLYQSTAISRVYLFISTPWIRRFKNPTFVWFIFFIHIHLDIMNCTQLNIMQYTEEKKA